jgi:excisionase family DNA binding protein
MAANDFIWIEDAAREYKRSRDWLYRQIREGKLTGYNFPGDRRVYLSREQLDQYLKTARPITDAE